MPQISQLGLELNNIPSQENIKRYYKQLVTYWTRAYVIKFREGVTVGWESNLEGITINVNSPRNSGLLTSKTKSKGWL